MVFERLFPEQLLERKEWTAFFLAVIYSTISIIIARLLFPANSGIVSVVFVSIFLIPYFETILAREELQERREKRRDFLHLFRDNADAIRTYFFLFFGIYLTYMLYAFLGPILTQQFGPSMGWDISSVFREQLTLEGVRGAAMSGGGLFSTSLFTSIVFNNWWVLLACFLIALVAGDGAIFFIAWNASTWGSIFGYRAFAASAHTGESALLMLLIILLITLPHLVLEGGAYILAAIAGGVLSDEIIQKSEEVAEFVVYIIVAGLAYVFIYYLLRHFLSAVLLGVLAIGSAFAILYCLHLIFSSQDEAVLFRYNFYLFAFAVGIFILGAVVETLVLMNATPLQYVYRSAVG